MYSDRNDDVPIPLSGPFQQLEEDLKDLLEEPAFMQIWQEEQNEMDVQSRKNDSAAAGACWKKISTRLKKEPRKEKLLTSGLHMNRQDLKEALEQADKPLLLSIGLAAHLNPDEVAQLLSCIQESFNFQSITDRIVIHYLKTSFYTMQDVKDAFEYFALEPFSCMKTAG